MKPGRLSLRLPLGFGAEFLAVELRESGLVVPGVHGTHAAIHEELDDALHLRRMMDATVKFRFGKRVRSFTGEHLRERKTREASAKAGEKITTQDGMRVHASEVHLPWF